MNFASIRIITEDVERLISFYESVTGQTAQRATEDFAQIVTTSASLAIGSRRTVGMLGEAAPQPASNSSVIIEFRVDNVDTEYDRVRQQGAEIVLEPTTMPWATDRCCSGTPTVTWSISSRRPPPDFGRSKMPCRAGETWRYCES